MMLIG